MLGKIVGDEFNNVVVGSRFVVVGFCEENFPEDDERFVVEGFREEVSPVDEVNICDVDNEEVV